MSDKQNFSREEFLEAVRGANGTRAQWFYLFIEDAKRRGIDLDELCKATIYEFGLERGKKYGVCKTPGEMAEMLYNSNGQDVFDMELVENSKDRGDLQFHYCPLAATWKSLGLSVEECKELCRLASYSDYARADCAGMDLDIKQTIASGDPVCELVFTPKAAEGDGE